jgi:hypothetical protein
MGIIKGTQQTQDSMKERSTTSTAHQHFVPPGTLKVSRTRAVCS